MPKGFADWLLADPQLPKGVHSEPEQVHPWWRVMCLTGVDYFSTLGYQPGIAFLAAGVLSPFATLVLVLVTLFAALPLYRRVAQASPNGQGSIAMLEDLFPQWGGKIFVLVLLGFASTDFIITMTLSAADAAAHFIHNPLAPHWLRSQMLITLLLLTALAAIFLKGFKEAIGIATGIVGTYLVLNAVVATKAVLVLLRHPDALPRWRQALTVQHAHWWQMVGVCLLLFPRLALGLSGFETGVAVMPLIAGSSLEDRIRNTRKLLTTAAVIMSVYLILTSFVTTLLIPAAAFQRGGVANGRAMAYLAHQYCGSIFGSVYDVSTILILAFAGASALAGLLNLIPRYLPGFGMAPEWARVSRPLILVFMAAAFLVTLAFHADVDAQGGAYATGVLVLITSAACAVTLSSWHSRMRIPYLCVSVIFVYTTAMNIWERPQGLKISSIFIFVIIVLSLISRATRSTELRVTNTTFSDSAKELLAQSVGEEVRIVPRVPREANDGELDRIDALVRHLHRLGPDDKVLFFEVERTDASKFSQDQVVEGRIVGRHCVLHAESAAVPNSIAALLLAVQESTGRVPHVYFKWKEGNPVANLLRFIFLGEGDEAPLTHEILRRAVPDSEQRPVVHVS